MAITYLGLIKQPGYARTIILAVAVPIAILAYGADVADRLNLINLSNKGPLILGWGEQHGIAYMTVDSGHLREYRDKFKMMFIVEGIYDDTDRMTDTHIERSQLFTITGDVITMAISLHSPPYLRIIPPPNYRLREQFSILADFNLIVIPNDLSPDQIRSLADVSQLGGRIIDTHASNMTFIMREQGGNNSG